MSFKSYAERREQDIDLLPLCEAAHFIDWKDQQQLENQSSFVKNVLSLIISPVPYLFYHGLHKEGIEFFVFNERHVWRQFEQTDFTGLSYFCFPNWERVEHEKDVSSRENQWLDIDYDEQGEKEVVVRTSKLKEGYLYLE